jgi:hypothetical protein
MYGWVPTGVAMYLCKHQVCNGQGGKAAMDPSIGLEPVGDLFGSSHFNISSDRGCATLPRLRRSLIFVGYLRVLKDVDF